MADPTALFSVAEARAFDRAQLTSSTSYPDATIEAMEAEIREQFEQICGVSFIPKTETDYYIDGTGESTLWLPFVKLRSVSAATIYDSDLNVVETLDATDLAAIRCYDDGRVYRTNGTWPSGRKNVKITFIHGHGSVPYAIKRAALMLCVYRLVGSDIDPRAVNLTTDAGSITLAMGGDMTELPFVNSVLRQYSQKAPAVV